MFVVVTAPKFGNGNSSCDLAMVELANVVPAKSVDPKNGLATVALRFASQVTIKAVRELSVFR